MAQEQLPYQDRTLPIDRRVSDIMGRMALEEKAGLLFHNMLRPGPDGTLSGPVPAMSILDSVELLENKHMSHFNLIGPITDVRMVASWHNRVQQHVLDHTRLGIPVSFSSDPRHHFSTNIGTGFKSGALSQWPETWGFGALRNPELARTFGDCVRREYTAVGLRVALHPQADLATEYRWARSQGTFSEDTDLAAQLVSAYIEGLQGGLMGPESEPGTAGHSAVATMTKHFPGAGPQKDGEDPHFTYGREHVYPGDNFEYHLKPFRDAIKAGTRQIMPAYGMPVGTKYEEVGMAFNNDIITGLLRNELGFDGVVCTDWGLITDVELLGQDMPARAWGCEHLSEVERVVKILNAGCDQFGGESRPELVVQAVQEGLISEERIDESVRRVLKEKFVLGLFDDKRFVDVESAVATVGLSQFVELGKATQRRAFALLVNGNDAFPLREYTRASLRYYVEGLTSPAAASERDIVLVPSPDKADVALLRLKAPFEPRPGGFEAKFSAGSLDFAKEEVERIRKIAEKVRFVLLDIYLDRPAVLTPLFDLQQHISQQGSGQGASDGGGMAIVVNFGADDDAFLDLCFGIGEYGPEGRLPFDLPRSMQAVQESREDTAFDTEDPLFRFGSGISFKSA